MKKTLSLWSASLILVLAFNGILIPSLPAQTNFSKEDNTLTQKEKSEGWILLFDGRTLDGWLTSAWKPSKIPVQDGCINPHGCGDYMMVHTQQWANFQLALDFKITKDCNSGVFVHTSPLTPRAGRDVGFNGVE